MMPDHQNMDLSSGGAGRAAHNAYDDLPYTSRPFKVSHPDHLHAMARLFRLQPALPEEASILELGCASGGNLIPLAEQMPNARVVGVDLSARQIAAAQATVDALGLKNCRLHAMDFQAIDASFGSFDYIICHGVLSWVSATAQQRVFEVCRERLSPHGVAYISYNAYPGWFFRGAIRQMMLYHTAALPDAAAKATAARALLAFLVDGTDGQNTPYAGFLRQEVAALNDKPDDYLIHDHLEDNNLPLFFYQFIERAQAHGLQFLGESNLADMIVDNLPPKAAQALTKLTPDLHQRAQYSDFLVNRMFRRSLLCRAECALDRQLSPASIDGGLFAAPLRLDDAAKTVDLNPQVEAVFVMPDGHRLPTKNPVLKALSQVFVDAWPQGLTQAQLFNAVQAKLASAGFAGPHGSSLGADKLHAMVTGMLLTMLVRGHAQIRFVPDRFVNRVNDRPKVSALTRLQCREARGPLTTQKHTMFSPDVMTRLLASQLDGSRKRHELIAALSRWVGEGIVQVSAPPGKSLKPRDLHAAAVDYVLDTLRQQALLVA